MLRVFSPVDTTFISNGDAILRATRAVVSKTDNGDYYLEIETSLDDIDYFKPNNIIVAPTPQGDQAFRIDTYETTGKKIIAKIWHISYDMENYLIADSYVVNKTASDALNHLNEATDNPSPFIFSSDVSTINSFRCVRKSLYEAVNTVIDRWGGHLVRDNYNISLKNIIGEDNGVTIQYKKNLKEISVNYEWSEVCTKVLPVGKDGYTLDELYLYSEIQYDIPYTKSVSFEQDIEAEDYPDEDSYKAALRADLIEQATAYLSISQYPAINYTLSANIEKITDVGDLVEVYDERLGVAVSTSVLSFEYDCILGAYTSVVFGTLGASLSDLMTDVSTEISTAIAENTQNLTVNLQAAIEVAEARIWTALGSSYCIFSGDQILIIDRLPAEEAINVLRIDERGISSSSSGINGTYTTIWSIDGTFNAAALDIVNFTADLIKGGTLKIGSNLNTLGDIEIYDSENRVIGTLDNGGLLMYAKDGSYLVVNPDEGFVGYDRLNNRVFWSEDGSFHTKKSMIEEEITLFNKVKFIPIEVYESNTLVNDGIGLVSVIN